MVFHKHIIFNMTWELLGLLVWILYLTSIFPKIDDIIIVTEFMCPARVAPYSWPGGCEFKTQLRQTFFLAYFHLSPLLKHVRKVVGGFGKKVVLELVRESQEKHVRHWPP